MGFIILLVDWCENLGVLSFPRRKLKRVVRSVAGAEVFTFPGAVEEALILPHDLKMILGRYVPLKALTDHSYLFNIMIRSTLTT